MPVRKPATPPQFDLFAPPPEPPVRARPPQPANDQQGEPARRPAPAPAAPAATDEWWTTRMACSFLKISRKTLWERRRDEALGFPQPVQLGGSRNLYRASAIRGWAERMATREDGP